MIFRPLPAAQVLAAVEGQECILPDVDTAARSRVEKSACPECGDAVLPVVDPANPFDNQTAGFRYVARCSRCGCIFDHESGVIRKVGCSSPILPPTSMR